MTHTRERDRLRINIAGTGSRPHVTSRKEMGVDLSHLNISNHTTTSMHFATGIMRNCLGNGSGVLFEAYLYQNRSPELFIEPNAAYRLLN